MRLPRLVAYALAALASLVVVAPASATPKVLAHEDHEHDAQGEHPKPPPPDATGFHDPPTTPSVDVHVQGDAPPRSATETVRDRSIVRASPHRTAGDVLMIVPGVFVTQHSGQGKAYQIFFRGFDSVHGQDVELWVGGAPVNDVSNIHGQGYADLHFVMPEVVSEVRSLPGTYDPRQGDFAVAGTMRFELGWERPGVTAKTTTGSYGERRLFLAYHPAGEPDATFGAFETQTTDGFGPSRGAKRTSAIGQQVFDLGKGATARVLATAYATRFDSPGVLPYARFRDGADRFEVLSPKQGGASSRAQLVLDLGQTRASESALAHWSIAPYVVLRTLRLRQDYTGFLVDPIHSDHVQQTNDATTFGATGHYQRKLPLLGEHDTLELGFSLRHDRIEQSQLRLSSVDDHVVATDVDARVLATDIGGWLDGALRPAFFKRLTLRGGFRVDGLSYSTIEASGIARTSQGAQLGPKASIDVRLVGGLRAVASYGEGFRSPQARSLAEGERTPFTRVRSFELGVRYKDDVVTASLAGFRTALSQDLIFDPASARNERTPETIRLGFAGEIMFRPSPAFVSTASVTWTRARFAAGDARYAEGEVVPYAPQLVARTDLAWIPDLTRVGKHMLSGRFGFATTSLVHRPLPYGARGDDVFLVDASTGVSLAAVTVTLDVFNLLGAQWWDSQFVYASRFGGPEGLLPQRHVTAGAPRMVLLSLSIQV